MQIGTSENTHMQKHQRTHIFKKNHTLIPEKTHIQKHHRTHISKNIFLNTRGHPHLKGIFPHHWTHKSKNSTDHTHPKILI